MENRVPSAGAVQIDGKTPAAHRHLCFANPGHCSIVNKSYTRFAPGMVLRLCPELSRNHLPVPPPGN